MGILEPSAILTTDTIFTWQLKKQSINHQCRLRIYKFFYDRVVVIASALPDYSSELSCQTLQYLINEVCYRFGIAPSKTMWIEHYPAFNADAKQFYYHVLLIGNRVCLYKVGQQQLEFLLGQKI
ncbi:MAG: hypothetical protein Tsb0014_42390 [Pleurocapsa sp.]